jgi:hypothetical protein
MDTMEVLMAAGKEVQDTATETAKTATEAADKAAEAPAPKASGAKKATDK